MFNKDHSDETSAIFHTNARKIFGLLLSLLCDKANISQRELGRRSESYRNYLIKNRHIQHAYSTGGIQQSAICRAVKGEFPLTYSQVFIWLHLLREVFESDEYKAGKPAFNFSRQLEIDMWRLALYGTPDEVTAAYRKYEHMLKKDPDTEKLPTVRRTIKLIQESTQY
jgi:hypothetical protein